MLQAVGVLAVPAVGRSPGGLNVGDTPILGVQRPKRRRRMEGSGTDFTVVRLQNDATALGPIIRQRENDLLKGHLWHIPLLLECVRGSSIEVQRLDARRDMILHECLHELERFGDMPRIELDRVTGDLLHRHPEKAV